jgi:hypothetical protein
LPDYFERWHYGSLATVTATNDLDGDGLDERSECIAGTEPTNSASRFVIQDFAAGTNQDFGITIPTVAGRAYTLMAGPDPGQVVAGAQFIAGVPETNGVFSFHDTNAAFMRVIGVGVTAPP